MSRLVKYPISVPTTVEVASNSNSVTVKGPLGEHHWEFAEGVSVHQQDNELFVSQDSSQGQQKNSVAGTVRSIIKNMIQGVDKGFEKKLVLEGVGYRAQLKGDSLEINVGFSHLVNYLVPEGITIETPSQTEIIVKGINKQLVGQVAAEIRKFRPPEPYKGKGIRYHDEIIVQKEGKKK